MGMNSYGEIIDALGQAAICRDLCVDRRTPSAWKARGRIPSRWWPGIVSMCARKAAATEDHTAKTALQSVSVTRLAELEAQALDTGAAA